MLCRPLIIGAALAMAAGWSPSYPVATAQAPAPGNAPVQPCTPGENIRYICGLATPEDLIQVPGTPMLLVSSYSGQGISLIDSRTGRVSLLYPAKSASEEFRRAAYPDCPGAPDTRVKFSSHGLSIRRAGPRTYTLHVVHHDDRESIEIFTLRLNGKAASLQWNGCVIAPDPIGLNSVVGLPDGGFITTNFRERGTGAAASRERALAGENNGELWEWHKNSGWKKIAGSEAAGANGVELSPDGRWIYVAAWGSKSAFRMARDGKPGRDTVALHFRADNIHLAPDGMLYSAGQDDGAWQAVRIDPQTMAATVLEKRADTPAFGYASGAWPMGKELWIASPRGDRIAIVPAKP